jgi:hypothetical protein
MSDKSTQATAENLRADFLNATTTHARWRVLNRAIDWAVAASENATHYRQKAQTKSHTGTNVRIMVSDDSDPEAVQTFRDLCNGGVVRGHGGLMGEKVEGEERRIRAGDTVTWAGNEGVWRFVRHISPSDAEIREIVPQEAQTMKELAERIRIVPLSALHPARSGGAVMSDAERARAERIAAAHEPYE